MTMQIPPGEICNWGRLLKRKDKELVPCLDPATHIVYIAASDPEDKDDFVYLCKPHWDVFDEAMGGMRQIDNF